MKYVSLKNYSICGRIYSPGEELSEDIPQKTIDYLLEVKGIEPVGELLIDSSSEVETVTEEVETVTEEVETVTEEVKPKSKRTKR